MSHQTLAMTDALHDYLLKNLVREPPFLARLRAETARQPDSNMQISAEQGPLLAMLVKLVGARRIIELGTFTGYSSICMALSLPGDGELIACDVNAETTAIARRYWQEAGVESRIHLRLQPGIKTLDELIAAGEAGRFDFAFIDADKEGYSSYYDRLMTLLRAGGVIAVDNTLWSGRIADPGDTSSSTQSIRAFNAKVMRDQRVDVSLVPIGDGLTLIRKL